MRGTCMRCKTRRRGGRGIPVSMTLGAFGPDEHQMLDIVAADR